MMRIYATLKRRIMDGEFAPGARLDPARLRSELGASITPIRDALHRLTGEGLVESWQNEGFRIGYLSEPELRDQYGWSRLLAEAALRGNPGHPAATQVRSASPADYPSEVSALLQQIAECSPNHELRRSMAQMCDRAHPYRAIEARLLPDACDEVRAIEHHLSERNRETVLTLLASFHDRRIDLVPTIISDLRARDRTTR